MRLLSYILLIVLLAGCRTQDLLPSDYVNWFRDSSNGLRESKELGNANFTVQYKSIDFMALQELRSDDISKADLEMTKSKYGDLEYYNFEISQDHGHDILDNEFNDEQTVAWRVEYLLSYAQSDFRLLTQHDTAQCILYHFERNYSLNPITTLVLGIRKPKITTDDRTIEFNDQILKSGPVRITIQASAINNLPGIQYHHE